VWATVRESKVGSFIPVYLHDLEIQVGKHRLTAPLGFSDRLGVRFNLLGRMGILSHFKVCFDESEPDVQEVTGE